MLRFVDFFLCLQYRGHYESFCDKKANLNRLEVKLSCNNNCCVNQADSFKVTILDPRARFSAMSLLMSVKVPKHLTAKYLKKHYSLIPLFGFVGLGMVGATAYGIRLAVFNPDIAFRKKGNPEPFRNRVSRTRQWA